MSDTILLSARGLSKYYGAHHALDGADFDLNVGEVHALVGSNGAGKSTLVKILTGAVVPNAGELLLAGRPVAAGDPKAALDAGIACIYQEANLVPALSVLDNIVLGRHPITRLGLLDRPAQRELVGALLAKHDLRLDLDAPVQTLPTVQQKEVEIARALSLNARVILMDEPTAWLAHAEVEKLFQTIRQLRAQGVAVLYISHILDEIFAISDRVTVIRDGKVRLTTSIADTSKAALVEAMLGRELAIKASASHREPPKTGAVAIECRGLSKAGLFQDMTLQVRQGEIVCITGLVGAKRSEFVRALFGAEPADQGEILIDGRRVDLRHPAAAIRRGIGFVPEDRRRDGLFMGLPIGVNLMLAYLPLVTRAGLLVRRRARALGRRQIENLGIVPARLDLPARALSGGNQQKVLLGRWLAGGARILILDEPTVGVDVGAKADIYQLLRRLASAGAAILIVSSDMEEVLTVADRVVVMAQGRISRTFASGEATQDAILSAASGEVRQ